MQNAQNTITKREKMQKSLNPVLQLIPQTSKQTSPKVLMISITCFLKKVHFSLNFAEFLSLDVEEEFQERKLECLRTLELLLFGLWELANLPRHNLALTMFIDKTLNRGNFFPGKKLNLAPFRKSDSICVDWGELRRTSANTVLNTVVEVDPIIDNFLTTQKDGTSTNKRSVVDLKFTFNLKTVFGKIVASCVYQLNVSR